MSVIDSDFVSLSWDAGGSSAATNGGGASRTAWDAGVPADFFNTTTGAPKATATCAFTTATKNMNGTNIGLNVTVGTLCFVTTGDGAHITAGWYFVTTVTDNDNIILADIVDDGTNDTGVTVNVGGTIDGLASMIASAAALADATTVNCEVFIKGNETLATDLTLSAGGGTASTILHFLGVDSSWVRIVPTRVIASGGSIANQLLDTSIMPDITLNANVELHFDVNYVHVDGLFVHGNTDTHLVGSSGADFQQYTNCAFDNASTGDNAKALRGDANTYVENCDLIASGASGDTQCFNGDGPSVVMNCRLIQSSSDTLASLGIQSDQGFILNCLFDTVQGIAIKWIGTSNLIPQIVANCTFWECGVEVQYPNAAHTIPAVFSNNLSSGNDTAVIDNLAVNDRLFFGYYNRIIDFDTVKYPSDIVGDVGFQDITGAGTDFVSTANKNFNLLATSPAKEASQIKKDVGSHPSKDAASGGIIIHPGTTGGINA